MQKVKFKIKGLNSQSEAIAIEKKLKALRGVIMPKVNYESGKAVIVYDENKAKEIDLKKTINNSGAFRVSKLEGDKPAPAIVKVNSPDNQPEVYPAPSSPINNTLIFGVITGIAIMSIIINIILLAASN